MGKPMAKRSGRAAAALWLVAATGAEAAPSLTMMADSCAVCHGTDGRSVSSIDSLAGMSAREMIEEMNEMLYDPHEGRLMGVVAKAFSAQEIQALGLHFRQLGKGGGNKGKKEGQDD